MSGWLKVSTAITLRMGPFVDSTDGVTPETLLTITQADVRVSKAGAAFAQKNDTGSAVHDENGWYSVPLNTTDTGTVGLLTVAIYESGALPVWRDFMVVPAQVYDSLVGGTDALQVHANEITNNLITAAAINTGAVDADALADDATAEIADKILTRNIAGGSDTGRTVKQALRILRNRRAVSSGTLTVYQEDDSTPDWTAAVTTAAGNPVNSVDPA